MYVHQGLRSVVCRITTVVYTCTYVQSCQVSSPIHTLHTAITHVIEVLGLWGVSHAICNWNSREAPQFQYCNHVSDCSVQCVNGTRNPRNDGIQYVRMRCTFVTVILKVWVFAMAMLKRCVSADMLCNLKLTMLLLYVLYYLSDKCTYVTSVGLQSSLYRHTYIHTCRYFPLPSGVIMQYC